MLDPDSKWPIPERFRASLDVTDEQAHALLLKCDAAQKELGAKINAPFTRNSPLERAMSKAFITIASLESVKIHGELTDDQKEIMAEAFAAIGRYDLASETTLANRELYEQYWAAVWRNDGDWCFHPPAHKYVKEKVFSIRDGKIKPLLACNICRTLNVTDELGDELQKLRKAHDETHAARLKSGSRN